MTSTLCTLRTWLRLSVTQHAARRVARTGRSVASSLILPGRAIVALVLVTLVVPVSVEDVFAQSSPPAGGFHQLGYEQLDQLVAPIALYPDALVAQILGAATFAPQVAAADGFVQRNAGVSPQELARMADAEPWDPSVKALVAFPSVLSQMDHNLDWATRLGNAYYNQPQDVMSAVQTMRQRAYAAGTLRTSQEETVVYTPSSVVIEPVNPAVVYVPVYNPGIVYGAPVPLYPTYVYAAPPAGAGAVAGAAAVGFTVGIVVGAFAHYGWGWGHWGCGWGPHPVVAFNHVTYVSHSVTVINHGYYGGYEHSYAARTWNQHIAYGPRGGVYTDQRSVSNGVYSNTRTATGAHGATYSDQRTVGNGQATNDRSVTRPDGASYTDQRTTSHGETTNTRTYTNRNGKTRTRTRVHPH